MNVKWNTLYVCTARIELFITMRDTKYEWYREPSKYLGCAAKDLVATADAGADLVVLSLGMAGGVEFGL